MGENIEVLAYHGWGFDSKCWKKWQQCMPKNLHWSSFNRGYFGKSINPEFSKTAKSKIVLTHSFGLHLCANTIFKKADLIAIIAGFQHFHPQAAQFRRRSKRVLKEMINMFDKNPHDVLKAFYRNVYHPEKEFEPPSDDINKSLLLTDLKKLGESKWVLPDIKKSARIVILHGANDAVVPRRKGRELYEKFGGRAQYLEIRNSGHALPMTHTQKCWQMMAPQIKD